MADSNVPSNPSRPIPILTTRTRSASVSSLSSGSPSSILDPNTPPSQPAAANQRISIPSPGSSPILSYFLGSSPTKPSGAFPFSTKLGSPATDDDESPAKATPVHPAHMRRASTVTAPRLTHLRNPVPQVPANERGEGILRRLSFSSAPFAKPQMDGTARAVPSPPPNSAVSESAPAVPLSGGYGRQHRAATMNSLAKTATSNSSERPRRVPSPMGERILRGHFDGFN